METPRVSVKVQVGDKAPQALTAPRQVAPEDAEAVREEIKATLTHGRKALQLLNDINDYGRVAKMARILARLMDLDTDVEANTY